MRDYELAGDEHSWAGRRVTVMGLGRHGGGLGAVRYLAAEGSLVTVSDVATAEQLGAAVSEVRELPNVTLKLGGHDAADFSSVDAIVVNPAVRPNHPLLLQAKSNGIALTSEIELLMSACPAPMIGITGSSGKSTTATMVAEILRESGFRCWLGGNIGGSLLMDLGEIAPTDWVVLELSSFQLARLSPFVVMPHVVAVTNCSPNHLDWHASYDDYKAAKQRLIREQPAGGVAVLSDADPEVAGWPGLATGQVYDPSTDSDVPELRVPGEHNRQNARLALQVARLAGGTDAAAQLALRAFRGLPHRLQLVAEVDGRRYWDDSKATTPAAAIAAVQAMSGRPWMLVGGIGKGAGFSRLAKVAARRALGVGFFGRDGAVLSELFAERGVKNCFLAEGLAEAFAWCAQQSGPGDDILLSPGCASLDQFRDFAHRGEVFRELVERFGARSEQAHG